MPGADRGPHPHWDELVERRRAVTDQRHATPAMAARGGADTGGRPPDASRDGLGRPVLTRFGLRPYGLTERLSMNRYRITRAPARHDEGAHMHLGRRKLRVAAVAVLAAVAMVAAACGSSGSSSSSGKGAGVSLNDGLQGLNPGTGAPQRGGTLNMLGTGDVDFMDYNVSYYTIGYLGQRMWVRGLYAYPAVPGQTT